MLPQEIFNSPYAVTAFRQYSEPIPDTFPTKAADLHGPNASESLVALSQMAKDNNIWLIGGRNRQRSDVLRDLSLISRIAGSIPEIEKSTDNLYNTCTVYNPEGWS
jgi:predicted amidohydrolase